MKFYVIFFAVVYGEALGGPTHNTTTAAPPATQSLLAINNQALPTA